MPLLRLFLPSSLPLQDKEVAISVPLDLEACASQDSPVLGLLRSWGGELWLQPAQRSGEATGRRWGWGDGRSRPKGGEEGRRRTRVPGLVTASSPGNRRSDTLREMAGDGDRSVVGTLHLLLLVATLPLETWGVNRGAAAWTQEKVRGCSCVIVPG